MSEVRDAADGLIEDDPAWEEKLRELLDVDEDGPWAFDDISLDSGEFGEVVSRGIAEKRGDAYRLADRDAVEAAITGEELETAEPTPSIRDRFALPEIDPRWAAALGGVLIVALLVRTVFVWSSVYKNGHVVLLENDPYFYRYWVERLLASDLHAFSIGSLGNLPGPVTGNFEVLLIVCLWWAAALLGGTPHAAGTVIAWYPVLAGLFAVVLVYLVGVRVGKDKRVGIAAAIVFTFTGIAAQRTALGYGDHHAFDLLWLVLGLYALTVLVDRMESPPLDAIPGYLLRTALPAVGLGIAITGQVTAWTAGALFILPIGLVVFLTAAGTVNREKRPLVAHTPILVGTFIGAILPALLDGAFGWLTGERVMAPVGLFALVVAVVLIAEGADRLSVSTRMLAGLELAAAIVGLAIIWFFVPQLKSALVGGLSYFQGHAGADISETIPLLGPRAGIFMGPIYHFGFVFYLAIPYAAWGIWSSLTEDQPITPVVPAVYGALFLVLSLIQFRFTFHLSLGTAVLGGIGIVHLASQVDLTDPPNVFLKQSVDTWRRTGAWDVPERLSLPSRRNAVLMVVLVVFLLNFALLTIPLGFNQFKVTDERFETAMYMNEYAREEGMTYPQNYVFSPWSVNRMFNYFVSGESRSYSYARANYERFLGGVNGSEWYDRLRNRPVGFIVTTDEYSPGPPSLYYRLHKQYGSRTDEVPALTHYRALYTTENNEYTVFELVPGAVIRGSGPANTTATASIQVELREVTFTYERQVHTGPKGQFAFRVPYPGTLEVFNRSIPVNETAVRQGLTVEG